MRAASEVVTMSLSSRGVREDRKANRLHDGAHLLLADELVLCSAASAIVPRNIRPFSIKSVQGTPVSYLFCRFELGMKYGRL